MISRTTKSTSNNNIMRSELESSKKGNTNNITLERTAITGRHRGWKKMCGALFENIRSDCTIAPYGRSSTSSFSDNKEAITNNRRIQAVGMFRV